MTSKNDELIIKLLKTRGLYKPCPKKKDYQIYFLRSGDDGPIKIGLTNDIRSRISILQRGNPEPLKPIKAIQGWISGEKEIHRRFKKDKIRGEWFNPTDELLQFIEKLPRCYMSLIDKKIFRKHIEFVDRKKCRGSAIDYDLPEFGELKIKARSLVHRR